MEYKNSDRKECKNMGLQNNKFLKKSHIAGFF